MQLPDGIVDAQMRAAPELLGLPGVQGVDVGFKWIEGKPTSQVAIRVFVESKRDDLPSEELIPARIDDFPTDVIESKVEAFGVSSEKDLDPTRYANLDPRRYDPVEGGATIALDRLGNRGTLGGVFRDLSNGGSPVGLTCYHVVCVDTSWSPNDSVSQPPPEAMGQVVRGFLTSTVDAALVSLGARNAKPAIAELGQVSGVYPPSLGTVVSKRGAASNISRGQIDGVNGVFLFQFAMGPLTLYEIVSIVPQDPGKFSIPGDSGALAVREDHSIVGMVMGGDTNGRGLAINIRNAMSALNVVPMLQSGSIAITVNIQNQGLQTFQAGEWAGTRGQSLSLEAFSLNPSIDGVGFVYWAHIENLGDQGPVFSPQMIGTTGWQSLRLEGFAITLTGPKASRYNVFYRAHLQDTGDTRYYQNGEFCGTRGQDRRVEAIWVTVEPR